jgi:hypothetical protein
MSSAVFSTSAAHGRPFVFDNETVAEVCPQPTGAELFGEARPPQRAAISQAIFKDARLAHVTPASRLEWRSAPEMVSSGIAEIDALTGGFPRGCLTEISGSASSGRSTLLLAALAAATRRGEYCAIVDASDALDPQSVADAGVELDRVLWVRCGESHREKATFNRKNNKVEKPELSSGRAGSNGAENRLEQLMRVADLLLESGGFGLIALDLGDIPPQNACRIPLATWFRFRRAVEHTPTVLLAMERQSIAGSCSALLIKLGLIKPGLIKPGLMKLGIIEPELAELGSLQCISGKRGMNDSQFPLPSHAQLLTEVEITAELVRSRMERKPVRSAEITFAGKTAWAG